MSNKQDNFFLLHPCLEKLSETHNIVLRKFVSDTVTNVSMIFNKEFSLLEQKVEVKVSLKLSTAILMTPTSLTVLTFFDDGTLLKVR